MSRTGKRVLVALAAVGAAFVAALVAGFVWLDRPLPTGAAGPAADETARRMTAAVGCDAWRDVEVVRFTFAGGTRHVWDRRRGLARVAWSDVVALVDLDRVTGVAYREGARVDGDDAAHLVRQAYERWVNDTFWLNPVCTVFDTGVERRLVTPEGGGRGLLVTYTSGGVTPGDSYLWLLDADDRPLAWRMWVSILPLGGLRATWDDWLELPGGAAVATSHRIADLVTVTVTDIDTAPLPSGPDDPFRDINE